MLEIARKHISKEALEYFSSEAFDDEDLANLGLMRGFYSDLESDYISNLPTGKARKDRAGKWQIPEDYEWMQDIRRETQEAMSYLAKLHPELKKRYDKRFDKAIKRMAKTVKCEHTLTFDKQAYCCYSKKTKRGTRVYCRKR